ncbi:MAG: GGDEF domain-containing protein, partial [Candidatus Binatia bacterium]|nr:GGDEF domain-containing protein [Candidatus Binatia bacterium]
HAAYCSLLVGMVDQYTELTRRRGALVVKWLAETLTPLLRHLIRASDELIPVEDGIFLIVLAKTPLDGAVRLAERLRACVEHTHFLYDGVELRLSLSLGVGAIRTSVACELLSDRLGRTLFSLLQAGGNRVEVVREEDSGAAPA